jgi:prepilin-type processing-associated H-X9-DG protein
LTGYYFAGNTAFGRTNYAANAGYLGNLPGWPYQGPFGYNTKTTITAITDGTSNSLMFGEALGGDAPPATRNFVMNWGSANLPTAWGLATPSMWYQYGSMHSGVVNFSLCDGSVRALKTSITSTNFSYASGINDGAVGQLDN